MASKAKRIKLEVPAESPISRLSDDVLLEVFEFLEAKALKDASLVCVKWNEVISSNKATMKKFDMVLPNSR